MYEVTERLYLTEDGRLVREGVADARWLHCIPGDRLSDEDAERYGLTEQKAADRPAENKARMRAANKQR